MKCGWRSCFSGMLAALALSSSLAGTASAQANTKIASRMREVNGLKLHYLTAGHGPTVILLHGYTQTSRMWKPIIPLLAAKFTVIAPDLPGIGDSGIPTNGLDMKTRQSPYIAWLNPLVSPRPGSSAMTLD